MKQHITVKRCHARSVRPDPSGRKFTFSGRSRSPSLLLGSDFAFATLSAREEVERGRGAERDAIGVGRVVVVGVAVVVHIAEVRGGRRQRGAQPVVARANLQAVTYHGLPHYCGRFLYLLRSASMMPRIRVISLSTIAIHSGSTSILIPPTRQQTSISRIMSA